MAFFVGFLLGALLGVLLGVLVGVLPGLAFALGVRLAVGLAVALAVGDGARVTAGVVAGFADRDAEGLAADRDAAGVDALLPGVGEPLGLLLGTAGIDGAAVGITVAGEVTWLVMSPPTTPIPSAATPAPRGISTLANLTGAKGRPRIGTG